MRGAPECRLVGQADKAQVAPLLRALTALSGDAGTIFRDYEAVHCKVGPPAVEVTLRRRLQSGNETQEDEQAYRWRVSNETQLQRGIVRQLPVAVVMVTQAETVGPKDPQFWDGLGSTFARENVREGRIFELTVEGQAVRVTVSQLLKLSQKGNISAVEEADGGAHIVQIACGAQVGMYEASAAACMRLQEQLAPYVQLTRD